LKEIIQPFIDFAHAPRAIWGINIPYLFEGMVYFGMLTLLAIFFNEYVGLDDHRADIMVGILTGGITLSMFFLGGVADKIGVRKFMVFSLSIMLVGRIIIALGAEVLPQNQGMYSYLHLSGMLGILFVVIGYGIYQPGCYAAVRVFTNKDTAAMGYAMLYALMNLGGFLPALLSPPIRTRFGINAVFWVYIGFTVLAIGCGYFLLTKKAIRDAKEKLGGAKVKEEDKKEGKKQPTPVKHESIYQKLLNFIKNHPLTNVRFTFFIFILIPVQTLFAHQWLTLPQYVYRAFSQEVSDQMEFFVNLNPLLIFVLTPIVAAMTRKKDTYRMMIIGTFVHALPTFFLAMGTNVTLLFAYIFTMSIGEAMWQPRFLQWVAEIAPEGRTGAYMGIGQLPWFLTKVITSLYAGLFLMKYVPQDSTTHDAPTMWLIYGFIALISPICLFFARKWARRGVEEKH
jgi:POT family proton-dependent oligopeptide transporter